MKRIKRRNGKGYLIAVLMAIFFLMPKISLACEPKSYAKEYINQIHAVFGGDKPALVVEKGINKKIVAFYNEETGIHIFKGDYKGACEDTLPYLKSVIAHEYAHHISSKIKKVVWIAGRENLAEVGEHAIADGIFGDEVFYDNDLNEKYAVEYEKILNFIENKNENKRR